MWLHSLKVAQLLRSATCLHTNQSWSYLNHLVYATVTLVTVQSLFSTGSSACDEDECFLGCEAVQSVKYVPGTRKLLGPNIFNTVRMMAPFLWDITHHWIIRPQSFEETWCLFLQGFESSKNLPFPRRQWMLQQSINTPPFMESKHSVP